MKVDMKVSVVIPVYNAEQFVRNAVLSALDQVETVEVILAEDNSTDDSLDVCKSLEKEFQSVLLVRHPDGGNHGAGATRNLGVRNATMEYLAFLDADDFYLADRFKVAAELFNEHENIDGVYEAIGVCFEDEKAESKWISLGEEDITTISESVCPEKLCDLLLEGGKGTFHLDGLTVKRSIFEECGFFFENLRLHQDTAMIIQMAQFGSLYPGRLDTPVALRRVHSGNRFLSDYNRYFTSSLMWKTLFEWSIENRIQIDRKTAVFLHYLYFMYRNVIDRRSGKRIDIQELLKLTLEILKHPILSVRALREHLRRKNVIIPRRIVFVMLGKKDFHSGGYGFNFRMVEYLRSHGIAVEIIHFTTVPVGLPLKWFSASRYICREIRRKKPDLVVVSKSYQYVPLLRLMKTFMRTPVIYLMHHLEWMDLRNKLKAFMYRMYVRWLLGMANLIWSNSMNTLESIEDMGIPSCRIRLINPGFKKDLRPLPDRSLRGGPVQLLCVGSISPRKAQHLLVEACKYLDGGSFEVEFAGSVEADEEYAASVLDTIKEYDLSDSIRISGELSPEDLAGAYIKADILVHPARWEAFGMSILDGMWFGLPVIASDIAAIPELIRHGVNGLLTPPGSAEELAGALNSLIGNRDLRLQMGEKSRMFAENMNDWDDTGKEFMELVMTAARGGTGE